MSNSDLTSPAGDTHIAIIGMSGRFPGARSVEEFWRNLRDGVESIAFFSEEELRESGIPPFLAQSPDYVPARAILDDVEQFDAAFFGFSPREAAIMDPQHRVFLECAWEVLERAGYNPEAYAGAIGVYAGASMNSYLFSVYSYAELIGAVNDFQTIVSNDKDFLATRVSYQLNLRGPSVNVQTACSTSLVAVHLACQSLLTGECDMALAGGVSIRTPQRSGHLFQKGAILSSDGHCRAFDASADGTVNGNGVGVVLLKRLANAIADGDTIHAVIRGSAINNDGALKVGFTAPSVAGQAAAIAEAQLIAGVEPRDISYVEAHGTGTALGDPIEIAALNEVFRESTDERGFCAIGSVKTNIGHLDAAAGVTGLIKTALALKHQQIPPSLHFRVPNPKIDFAASPFFVNSALSQWNPDGPRLAGVSSFGIGGTNAHVILEEAPVLETAADEDAATRPQLLVLSAKTRSALDTASANLATQLKQHADLSLADAAYTLQVGRRAFNHRRMLVCRSRNDAIAALEGRDPERVVTHFEEFADRPVAFMFPGQATQYAGMALELYEHEPTFRAQIDRCAELLMPHLGLDLRDALYPDRDKETRRGGDKETPSPLVSPSPGLEPAGPARAPHAVAVSSDLLHQTEYAQPAIFAVEYALAKMWMEWGVRPKLMIGHSLGEYVAACLAGVFSLEDALALVAARGRLMQQHAGGAMLSVAQPADQVQPLLGADLALAAINGPALCVIAGPAEAVAALETELVERRVECKRLRTGHAFHSAMMDPILDEFAAKVGRLTLKSPRLPFISNVTGMWIRAEEATSPDYWARQLRQTVRFSEGLRELIQEPDAILLEVGPGQTLSALARAHADEGAARIVLASLGRPSDPRSEHERLLSALGRLWLNGAPVDWEGFHRHEQRRRVPLPTYPFERRRCWIDSRQQAHDALLPREPAPPEPAEAGAILEAHPRPALATDYVAPRDEVEQALAEIWQELLGIERVGMYDNFFDLGGHSLLVTQLLSRLRETFEVDLPPQRVFEASHIAELAAVIQRSILDQLEMMSEEDERSHHDDIALRQAQLSDAKRALLQERLRGKSRAARDSQVIPRRVADPPPLSFAQERFWFVDQLLPDNPAFNIPAVLRLDGALDRSALQRALDMLAARHETLRTTFALREGQPVQLIAPPARVPLALQDLLDLSPAEREAEVNQIAAAEARQPFDLARGPLWRVRLLCLGDEAHVLLLTMHHSIADEWSIGVFVRELTALYTAAPGGALAPLPALPIQYADYAVWQRQWLQGAGDDSGSPLQAQLDYWKEQLAGAPGMLALPTDRPRPAVQSFHGASQSFTLPPSLADALVALSRQSGATLFMTLLAAWQALLSRYSGQEQVVVSSGVANRNRRETEPLIGCLINILLLRGDLAGDPTFRALLGRVRATALAAYQHQDLPFEKLIEALQPERDLSYHPFSQVMFVLLNTPAEPLELPGLRITPITLESTTTQYDLLLHMWSSDGGLDGRLRYSTDLFDDATIARLLGHFRTLLEAIVADPDRRVSALPLLGEDERRQLLVEWNNTRAEYPRDACLHELFEAHARQQPDATAAICAGAQLTYAALDRRANQLAQHLCRLGVGPNVAVGICTERSLETVVGLLGILKAGGAYLPLDPTYPPERILFMLEDSGATVLLTMDSGSQTRRQEDKEISKLLVSLSPRLLVSRSVINLRADWASIAQSPAEHPHSGARADDLAYLIYTSGSTGTPKGVMLDHRGRVNNFYDYNQRFVVGPDDRLLALSSLSFDMSAYDILGTLAGGAAVVLPAAAVERDPAHWVALLHQHRVTIWHSAPALLELLLEHVRERAGLHPRSLRLALLGGDWIPLTLPERLKACAPDVKVISLGGATEVSMDSTIYPVEARDPAWKSIPYGYPLANQLAYVLDAHMQLVPIGIPGELLLGGDGVGWGYLGRPDLTAERFVPNPFSHCKLQIADCRLADSSICNLQSTICNRLYRTGDLARYRPDGSLELLGRIDYQVKIRGVRIELGEIAARLNQHPAVAEAIVVVREPAPGDQRLVAYLVPTNDQRPTTIDHSADKERGRGGEGEDSNLFVSPSPPLLSQSPSFLSGLRDYLKHKLPDYMVPSAFVLLDALPLTPNGKIDRKALPAPVLDRAGLESAYVAPRTPVEAVLTGIWSQVLGVEQVGVYDNFFALGGHSLLATRVIAQLADIFPIELPVRALFQAPTVEALAAHLGERAAQSQLDLDRIAQIYIQLQQLTEDEATTMFAALNGPAVALAGEL